MSYKMKLIINGTDYPIPVLPGSVGVQSAGANDSARMLSLGEVLLLRHKKLREISWSAYLPGRRDDIHITDAWIEPMRFINALQAQRDSRKPVKLVLTGFDLGINTLMGIDNLDYEERFGDLDTLYYSIKLRDWVDYAPQRLTLVASTEATATSEPVLELQEPVRSGEPEPAASHTVVAGDSLWAIAKRYYDDGDKYTAVYATNQQLIDAANREAGNSKYTIYPGQVLRL